MSTHYYAYRVEEMKVSVFRGDPDNGIRYYCWSALRGADNVQYDSVQQAQSHCDYLNKLEDWENCYPFQGEPYEGLQMTNLNGTYIFRDGHWHSVSDRP